MIPSGRRTTPPIGGTANAPSRLPTHPARHGASRTTRPRRSQGSRKIPATAAPSAISTPTSPRAAAPAPFIDLELAKAKYPERYQEYLRLKADKEYREVDFDPETGGLKATHIGHKSNSTKETYFGEEKLTAHKLEVECADTLFRGGHRVIFLDERKLDKDGRPLSALDMSLDGVVMDIRSITMAKDNYVNALTAKNKQLERYNLRSDVARADSLCLYFHDPKMFSDERIKASIHSYNHIMLSDEKERGKEVKQIRKLLVVIRGEAKVLHYEV